MSGLNLHAATCDYMSFIHYGNCISDCWSLESGGWASPRGMPQLSLESLEYYHPLVAGKGDSLCV